MGRNYRKVSEASKEKFLDGLRRGLTVRQAAELTPHPPVTFHAMAARDSTFREEKSLAKDIGTDVIEEEAYRRAVEGWDEPVVGKVEPGIDGHVKGPDGQPMFVRKHDGRLLEVLLKGRRPDYRDSPRIGLTNQTLVLNAAEDRSAPLIEAFKILKEFAPDVLETLELSGEVKQLPRGDS